MNKNNSIKNFSINYPQQIRDDLKWAAYYAKRIRPLNLEKKVHSLLSLKYHTVQILKSVDQMLTDIKDERPELHCMVETLEKEYPC